MSRKLASRQDRVFVVTCEHAGNDVPMAYSSVFASPQAQKLLSSHRGYDPGAVAAARQIADRLGCDLDSCQVTRLLVDLNRSIENPELLSKFSRRLPASQQQQVLQQYYYPYRNRVRDTIAAAISVGSLLVHLSVHTFTPRMKGNWRPIDVGLLFDPSRPGETNFCESWRLGMLKVRPRLRVVNNQPYAGTDDGFTTALRRQFCESEYFGIEIEISNRFFKRDPIQQHSIVASLLDQIPSDGR
ncbi:N-formylglutamate amidohydrolase [Rubripirellula amarantea]|uniref:N-formylglutamate amidohydrolase n=1 Tax=Rubripirellula amarantea TaxID=2527999 RepID=UPI0013EF443D|nr:N-formylglutamate amidohydrolase [Rubripirellula amarantea]